MEEVRGASLSVGRDYELCEGDEVEDLTRLLTRVRDEAGVEAVSVTLKWNSFTGGGHQGRRLQGVGGEK